MTGVQTCALPIYVRFMAVKDPEYGLLVTMQMIGHAGRDGKESHMFVIDTQAGQTCRSWSLTASVSVKQVLGDSRRWRVRSMVAVLDVHTTARNAHTKWHVMCATQTT